jgi:hypothetical protein
VGGEHLDRAPCAGQPQVGINLGDQRRDTQGPPAWQAHAERQARQREPAVLREPHAAQFYPRRGGIRFQRGARIVQEGRIRDGDGSVGREPDQAVTGGALGVLVQGPLCSGAFVFGDDLPGPLPHPDRHVAGGPLPHHLPFRRPRGQGLKYHPERPPVTPVC